MDLTAVSLHEAGHSVAHLLAGVRVSEVWVSATEGGGCRPAFAGRPVETIRAMLAGPAAVELLHGRGSDHEHEFSVADSDILRAAEYQYAAESGRNISTLLRRHWRDQALALVLNHESLIRNFAAELRERGRFDDAALASFCYRPRSIFERFAILYPRPRPVLARVW